MRDSDVLYGPMLSSKYAEEFLQSLEVCKASGADLIFGEGRITKDSAPVGFVADAEEGVYMWPHVYTGVTEDMECFHEEILALPSPLSKPEISIMPYIWRMPHHMGCPVLSTRTTGWRPTDSKRA